MKSKFSLILDIDETLISSETDKQEIVGDLEFYHFEDEFIIFRPYVKAFLRYCFKNYNVYFSTKMTKDRCDFVLDKLLTKDQLNKISEVRTREDCYETIPAYGSKESRKTAFECHCIWIDDSTYSIDFDLNYIQKVINVDPFDGDIVDSHLLDIIKEIRNRI